MTAPSTVYAFRDGTYCSLPCATKAWVAYIVNIRKPFDDAPSKQLTVATYQCTHCQTLVLHTGNSI